MFRGDAEDYYESYGGEGADTLPSQEPSSGRLKMKLIKSFISLRFFFWGE